jgi:hypothetical protein
MVQQQNVVEDGDDYLMGKYSKIKKKIQLIIEELPSLVEEEEAALRYPISYDKCINTLLTKEV